MAQAVPFPVMEAEANRALKEAAQELLDARFAAYRHASEQFERHPTTDNWLALVQARAFYAVAYHAEHGDRPK